MFDEWISFAHYPLFPCPSVYCCAVPLAPLVPLASPWLGPARLLSQISTSSTRSLWNMTAPVHLRYWMFLWSVYAAVLWEYLAWVLHILFVGWLVWLVGCLLVCRELPIVVLFVCCWLVRELCLWFILVMGSFLGFVGNCLFLLWVRLCVFFFFSHYVRRSKAKLSDKIFKS